MSKIFTHCLFLHHITFVSSGIYLPEDVQAAAPCGWQHYYHTITSMLPLPGHYRRDDLWKFTIKQKHQVSELKQCSCVGLQLCVSHVNQKGVVWTKCSLTQHLDENVLNLRFYVDIRCTPQHACRKANKLPWPDGKHTHLEAEAHNVHWNAAVVITVFV